MLGNPGSAGLGQLGSKHFVIVLVCRRVLFQEFIVIGNCFSAKSKSPELQVPSLKFEDVGGNEATLMVRSTVIGLQ